DSVNFPKQRTLSLSLNSLPLSPLSLCSSCLRGPEARRDHTSGLLLSAQSHECTYHLGNKDS
uniref:Uncharacterized protein n=1 Tax=Oryza brachyantha TaxID=4533 RepID=J3M3V2_ORYBR